MALGVMWPGVEPVRGQYNMTYLDVMSNIVKMCEDAGIYVILDFHQDGLSEKFCGEDQRLYDNYDGLRDSFVDYWKLVAKTFLGFKNILGYTLINEPWANLAAVNVVEKSWLLLPGVADRENLQKFYDVVADGIREVDPGAIIFFESMTWDNFAVGFTHVPGGKQFASKSVLSFHHYEPPQLYGLNASFIERLADMKRLGCGGMMTEFEMGWKEVQITGTNNGIRDPSDGSVRPDMAAVYSRTYATAITGVPTKMTYNDETGRFDLFYTHDGSDHLTEIRLNSQWHYGEGYRVTVSSTRGAVIVLADKEMDGFIYVRRDPSAGDVKGSTVHVRVSRASTVLEAGEVDSGAALYVQA
ncbi:hypothetical protein HK101_009992 [Irineochytrium annulatum]|nr:hypothetical protein HK101_009992 [Irineochytrium annulatum]